MTIKVIITIDTEEDQWGEFSPSENTLRNISEIQKLQAVFETYHAIPTYLIDYPVAVDRNAQELFKFLVKEKKCCIGTHCHPWNTPPFREIISSHNSMLCNLPYNLIFSKLETLHNVILKNFGIDSKCFRAGRWGFDSKVAKCIYNLNYKIDTSILPYFNWSGQHGPNFTEAKSEAYFFEPDNIYECKSNGTLLEVPCTSGFYQVDFERCKNISTYIQKHRLEKLHIFGLLDKLHLLNFRLLSPEHCSGEEMVKLSKTFIKKGCKYLNMTFHSTSLVPGLSPFVKSELDLKEFYNRITIFLNYIKNENFEFVGLDEMLEV